MVSYLNNIVKDLFHRNILCRIYYCCQCYRAGFASQQCLSCMMCYRCHVIMHDVLSLPRIMQDVLSLPCYRAWWIIAAMLSCRMYYRCHVIVQNLFSQPSCAVFAISGLLCVFRLINMCGEGCLRLLPFCATEHVIWSSCFVFLQDVTPISRCCKGSFPHCGMPCAIISDSHWRKSMSSVWLAMT